MAPHKEGPADDGKRFQAMDVVVACVSSEKGGGPEEGGLEIHPGGRAADYFGGSKSVAGAVFSALSRKNRILDVLKT